MPNFIKNISYYLPEKTIDCLELEKQHPDWDIANTITKTGVHKIHHAASDERTVEMAVRAAKNLLAETKCVPDTIIVCTQTPDTLLPQCSSQLQHMLGLPNSTMCLDINLGCSGYTHGLATAYSYLSSGISKKILFITVDNYSKVVDPENKKVFLLFSDASSATLLSETENRPVFRFGTDGSRSQAIACKNSGVSVVTGENKDSSIKKPSFEMDGYGVFLFTLGTIPNEIQQLMNDAGASIEDIDLFVLHQASRYVLESIQKKLGIPEDKLIIDLEEVGNTTSSSIPIALKRAETAGKLKRGDKILLFGFGIGLSWGGAILEY
ncbi:ketoacyl-ACP synthase III [Marinifilum sp. JC120]|nr:ketoacyl-ACP synthase III [Marinifilum sp. JC120]